LRESIRRQSEELDNPDAEDRKRLEALGAQANELVEKLSEWRVQLKNSEDAMGEVSQRE